ncbi:uncharacterized protein Atf-2 [Euwallacea fornicatus]|uniref:uncharacterized protein Atf-2 n=1 Tax=Euwallacea fornicatus TaxID=995702 RepID=UPI00338FEE1F
MSQDPVPATSDMSLSIHDLEWNKKKQDMIINLGLNSHSQSDETPTPTRFIRNCEQVGLFQDLQNVNPFDEEFKKAIESPLSMCQLSKSSEETTLHTPKIYSLFEDTGTNYCSSISPPTFTGIDHTTEEENRLIIDLDADYMEIERSTGSFHEKFSFRCVEKPTKNGAKKEIDQVERVRLLKESNKASQIRYRKRKQNEFERLKAENKKLRTENRKLKGMVLFLKDCCKQPQHQTNLTDTVKMSFVPIKSPPIIDTKLLPNSNDNNESKQIPIAPRVLPTTPSTVILLCAQPQAVQNPVILTREMQNVRNSELRKRILKKRKEDV